MELLVPHLFCLRLEASQFFHSFPRREPKPSSQQFVFISSSSSIRHIFIPCYTKSYGNKLQRNGLILRSALSLNRRNKIPLRETGGRSCVFKVKATAVPDEASRSNDLFKTLQPGSMFAI